MPKQLSGCVLKKGPASQLLPLQQAAVVVAVAAKRPQQPQDQRPQQPQDQRPQQPQDQRPQQPPGVLARERLRQPRILPKNPSPCPSPSPSPGPNPSSNSPSPSPNSPSQSRGGRLRRLPLRVLLRRLARLPLRVLLRRLALLPLLLVAVVP